MTNEQYIEGIATIIKDYRKKELSKPLDVAHVQRWIGQFEPAERSVVLQETFLALSRYYVKNEEIYAFINEVIEQVTCKRKDEEIVFASVQRRGFSQEFIYK